MDMAEHNAELAAKKRQSGCKLEVFFTRDSHEDSMDGNGKLVTFQTGQDTVESVAKRLEAQQQQLEDWQNAVSDARSKHYFLPLGARCLVIDLRFFPSLMKDLWVVKNYQKGVDFHGHVSLPCTAVVAKELLHSAGAVLPDRSLALGRQG